MAGNYELPIRFNALMQANKDLPTCDLKKSIAQNINLIITSKYNEHRFDQSYGCEIWDMDFELILNENAWRDKISKSVIQSLKKHERRLDNIDANVEIKEEEFINKTNGNKGIRKKISVYANGTIRETGDPFNFSTYLYLGPISFD
jgi:phage baseplate assembly protein W